MNPRPTPLRPSFRCASVDSLSELVGCLKKSVDQKLVRQFRSELPTALIRRAIDEAEHAARETDFPHLFLPELAAEQVRRMRAFASHDTQAPTLVRAA